MKIADLRTNLLTTRWADDPFLPAQLHSASLIQVVTDTGTYGLGETIIGYFAPETVPALVSFYKSLLIGQDPQQINRLSDVLSASSAYWWRSRAAISGVSAIAIALWDFKAKPGGVPNPYSLSEAQRIVSAIEPFGVLFFEEPLPYTDIEGYVELRRMRKVAIAGGESLSNRYEFHQFLQLGGLDVVQPEVAFVGG